MSMNLSMKGFLDAQADEKLRKEVKTSFILSLVLAILNIIIALAVGLFPLDGLILLAITVWWKMSPGKSCAIVALIYSIGTVLLGLIVNGQLTGWLIIIAAISMFNAAKKLDQAYSEYKKNGESKIDSESF